MLRPYPIPLCARDGVDCPEMMLTALKQRRGAACCAPTSISRPDPAHREQDLGGFFRRPFLRPPLLAQLRNRRAHSVRDLTLLTQRGDHGLRLFGMELERARLRDRLIQ